MDVEGCGRPTNLTNGDNHGTLKRGRLKRRTTPRVKLKKKTCTRCLSPCADRCAAVTWGLEVDPA